MRLSDEQIEEIKKYPNVNARKDALQNIMVKQWFKKPRGIFLGFTSIGKSYCIAKIIKLMNQQKPDATTCIIVPTKDLYKDFVKAVDKFKLLNVEVYVVNSFAIEMVKTGKVRKYDLLIADELHTLCNDSSKYFSSVIPLVDYKYFFGVSATLEREHLEYLYKQGLEVFFEVPLEDGYRANIVPDYVIYNIGVDFTQEEMIAYSKIQNEFLSIVEKFTLIDPFRPHEAVYALLLKGKEKDGSVKMVQYDGFKGTSQQHAQRFEAKTGEKAGTWMWRATRYQMCVTNRRSVIANSVNALHMTSRLLDVFKEPALVVCGSQKVADHMAKITPNSKAFHSGKSEKTNEKNKQLFTDGFLDVLYVVKGLKQGYNKDDLRLMIRHIGDGKPLNLTQFLGRLLRPDKNNPNKFSVLVHVYVRDFYIGGRLMESQQLKWLKSSLYGRSFVEWVDNVNQIEI